MKGGWSQRQYHRLHDWSSTQPCLIIHSYAIPSDSPVIPNRAPKHTRQCFSSNEMEIAWNDMTWKAKLCMLWSMIVYDTAVYETTRLCRGSPVSSRMLIICHQWSPCGHLWQSIHKGHFNHIFMRNIQHALALLASIGCTSYRRSPAFFVHVIYISPN